MVDSRIEGTDSGTVKHREELDVTHSSMTVREAKDFFAKFKDDLRPDVNDLARLFRDTGINFPVKNSNLLHAFSLTELMLNYTDNSFRMLTGGFGDGFIECLKSSFKEMLFRIKKASGSARVIFINAKGSEDSGESAAYLADLASEFKGVLQITRVWAAPQVKISHFIVCDDDMLRDEDLHEPLTNDASANLIKARVYFKNKAKSKAFCSRFDALWDAIESNKDT